MTIDEIGELLLSDPTEAFKILEKAGIDISSLKEIDIARVLVKERFQLTDEEKEAAEFVFWIAYFAEREIRNIILEVEKHKTKIENPMIDAMLDRLHFGDKIELINSQYVSGEADKEFVSMLWKINGLRNAVAHGRFVDLKYGGFALHDIKGQLKLIIDFKNAALKKK